MPCRQWNQGSQILAASWLNDILGSLPCGPLSGSSQLGACFFKASKGEGFLARQMLQSYVMLP